MNVQFDPVIFWNSLFDKGLLACVVLLLGYVLNRSLERLRSDIAIGSEAAKIRLAKISALWEEMSLWESDAKRTFINYCHAMLLELREAGLAPAPTGAPERESSIDALLALGDIPIPLELGERVHSLITPHWEELAKRATDIWRQLHRSRFWLKDDLFVAMGDFCIEMQNASVLLVPTSEGAAAGLAAFKALERKRENVDTVLERLLERPSRQPRKPSIPSAAP